MSDSQPNIERPRRSFPRPGVPSLYGLITGLVVGASSLLILSQLRPDLLVMNSTTSGGDMGAHVWAPRYLVDHLLPHGRLTGWAPDWYAGFPALQFYFPLPIILVAILDIVLPGAVAFKIVTVSGLVLLPVATWAFGRLANLPFPVPACLAAFTVPFLFSTGYSILGGNIPSALAGEFAFSVGLAIAMVFLGVVARGMQTGKHRGLASVLFGAVILSHILPTIFAFVAGLIIVVMTMITNAVNNRDRSWLLPLKWALPVGITGGLLSAWWLVPFVLRSTFMNDMGWEKIGNGKPSGLTLFNETITNYNDALFPNALNGLLVFAFASAALALYFRRRIGIMLIVIAAIAAIGFVLMPQGRLWNARLLPFWYLSLWLLAGLLAGEIGYGLAKAIRGLNPSTKPNVVTDISDGLRITAPLVALVVAFALVVPTLPEPSWWPGDPTKAGHNHKPWHDPKSSKAANYIPGWAQWNYAGYDGKKDDGTFYKPAYPEYKSVMDMLGSAGLEHGCGRVMWEYEPTLDRFGTPMALMLSPLYTKGCMGSMEGLYFESSATVPYHFLNQKELSNTPSSPMRDIPYAPGLDVSAGVTKLQLLGVKYYLAVTPEAQQQAAVDTRLTLVSSVPAANSAEGLDRTWNLYEIADSDLVTPLQNLPNVMTDEGSIPTSREGKKTPKHSAREAWLENTLPWYQNLAGYDTLLAADGPKDWPRIGTSLDEVTRTPTEPVNVTYSSSGDDRISFHVDKVGVPVLVKASYFPNWKASGAKGPYRVTPNLMVVIPTKNDVTLHYGRTFVDVGAAGMTLVGLVAVFGMWRWDRNNGFPDYIERRRRDRRRHADDRRLREESPAEDAPPGDQPLVT